MGFFERFLSVWVAICIAVGITLGTLFPDVFAALASLEYASVNLLVAVLIWAMVYPMMVSIDFVSSVLCSFSWSSAFVLSGMVFFLQAISILG